MKNYKNKYGSVTNTSGEYFQNTVTVKQKQSKLVEVGVASFVEFVPFVFES